MEAQEGSQSRSIPGGGQNVHPDTAPPKLNQTVSQLLARILDQLSLSAWLPAATLVFLAVLLVDVQRSAGHVTTAIGRIGSMNASSLVLLAAAVVLTTTITQAFEYEAIRYLEGYWDRGWVRTRLAGLCCSFHIWRRRGLVNRLEKLQRKAFAVAQANILADGTPQVQVDILAADKGYRKEHGGTPRDVRRARRIDWRDHASPADVRRLDSIDARLAEFPSEDRLVLPTRLGNCLRSHEERVYDVAEGNLEGFVQRVFDELPVAIQVEHDQFRTRLDLYCSLVFAFVAAGVVGGVLLRDLGPREYGSSLAIGALLAILSYRAAIASARDYGTLLETIGRIRRSEDAR